jgi:hypothetical protein
MIKELQTAADAEIKQYQARQWKACQTSNQEFEKCKRYCHDQREILRPLEDLKANERVMYELDDQKDQVITVFKVALTNLVMWTPPRWLVLSFLLLSLLFYSTTFHIASEMRSSIIYCNFAIGDNRTRLLPL